MPIDYDTPKFVFSEMKNYILKKEKKWVNNQVKMWESELCNLKKENKKLISYTKNLNFDRLIKEKLERGVETITNLFTDLNIIKK